MQKEIRPSVKAYDLFCEKCGGNKIFHLTNQEVWSNVEIKCMCSKCKGVRVFRLHKQLKKEKE